MLKFFNHAVHACKVLMTQPDISCQLWESCIVYYKNYYGKLGKIWYVLRNLTVNC